MQKQSCVDAGATGSVATAQSYLFVPATQPERFKSALASGADAVIVDLEDAVAPANKAAARLTLTKWLSTDHPVLIRINARGTAWFEDDMALGALEGVAGIVLSKSESAEDIGILAAHIKPGVAIYPLIETALGVFEAHEIAKAPHVRRLMFGTLDFIAEMGMADTRESLNYYRAQLALASRVAGLAQPVDGVTPEVHDIARLQSDALNGKRQGFGAKLCIHPKQIDTVHECFRPSDEELAWAWTVVREAAAAQTGAIVVDGKMVDRPVVLRAERLIALATLRSG